ncbi:MAG: hypothetical protein DRI73_01215, partial [Bacteroidetes bacterium]
MKLKNKNILFLFFLLIGFNMNTAAQEVKFGIVAGPNFSTFQSNLFDGNFRIGFHAGVMAEIELKNNFKLRPEIIYSQQGMVFKDSDPQSQTNFKNFNNY